MKKRRKEKKMITIKGEEFYSIKELGGLLGGLSFLGVFCFLRSSRTRCANVGGYNYASKEDILKSLDPSEKSDRAIIERIKRKETC